MSSRRRGLNFAQCARAKGDRRCVLTRRFRFAVVYCVAHDLEIIAVAHLQNLLVRIEVDPPRPRDPRGTP